MGYLFILYGILNEWKFFNLNIATVFQFLVLYKVKSYSHSFIQFFAIPWTVAHEAPLSMEFSRQEYWSGLPFPSPGDLPNPGIEPGYPALQADSLPSEPPGKSASTWRLILVFVVECVCLMMSLLPVAFSRLFLGPE